MPSLTHEALIQLFRDRPELAPELLEGALGVRLPRYTEVRTESAELTQVTPTEYRADLVVLLVEGKPVLGIIVEVQLHPDASKRFSWPVYVTTLRARLGCAACLLVVTANEEVARWAQSPIELGPGGRVEPLVVGPAALEKMMQSFERRGLQSEFARKYASLRKAQGKAQGKAEGKAESVLAVLEARGLSPSSEQRERILAITNLDELELWIRRAATASSVDELFC